jgi:hypothetical protein
LCPYLQYTYMDWKSPNKLTRYDKARVARLLPVSAALDALGLPLGHLRKLYTILNALEMQIEDGGDSPQVNNLLLDALRAGIRHQMGAREAAVAAAEPVLHAIDVFAQAEEERWLQVRAGTLPPIVPAEIEQLDDLIQQGYDLLESQPQQIVSVCDLWLAAWGMVKHLATPQMHDAEAFDAEYTMLQSVFNWSGDLVFELSNAGLDDPAYYEHLLGYTQEYLAQFSGEPPDRVIMLERERADALWALGRREEAEAAYAALTERFPDEGWAYIGWSDLYSMNRHIRHAPDDPNDFERAASILQQALARPALQDRKDVLMRVGEVYEAWGRPVPSVGVAALPARKPFTSASPLPLPLPGAAAGAAIAARTPGSRRRKLGRNAPCWCGSGKKYKHCHIDEDAKLR